MTLALVLGDKAEDAFRQSMIGIDGGLGIFWSNGLVGTITTLALIMLFWPLIGRLIDMVRKPCGTFRGRGQQREHKHMTVLTPAAAQTILTHRAGALPEGQFPAHGGRRARRARRGEGLGH